MQTKDLEQFMVDFFTENDIIEVNCRWLQKILLDNSVNKSKIYVDSVRIEDLEQRVNNLEIALTVYKFRDSSRVRLDTSC